MPEGDRPRERLLRRGPEALSDAELVAIQLGSGHAGASALEVARHLLVEWGGVAELARARPEELARATGVGPAKAARLVSAFALGVRGDHAPDRPVVRTSTDIARIAVAAIGFQRTEQVLVIVLDGASHIRRAEVVASGSAKSCPVPVREILATVLRHDGVAFAVAHNHPGGDPTPTPADVSATRAVRDAAATVGLRFLDHVVVAGTEWRGITAAS